MTVVVATEREAQITRLNGMSARRQRYWIERGYRIDAVWGNVSPPTARGAA